MTKSKVCCQTRCPTVVCCCLCQMFSSHQKRNKK